MWDRTCFSRTGLIGVVVEDGAEAVEERDLVGLLVDFRDSLVGSGVASGGLNGLPYSLVTSD